MQRQLLATSARCSTCRCALRLGTGVALEYLHSLAAARCCPCSSLAATVLRWQHLQVGHCLGVTGLVCMLAWLQ